MTRRSSGVASTTQERVALPQELGEPHLLLSTLYSSSTVGVAICDRQLRFCAINDTLASMNGLPASAHLGRTLHAVLGNAAGKVQPAFEQVFKTGRPLWNFDISAKLRGRTSPGHWNAHYFPIKDKSKTVRHIGAVVLELSRTQEFASIVTHLTSNLAVATSTLVACAAPSSATYGSTDKDQNTLASSVSLLQNCLHDVRMLSDLISSAPAFQTMQPGQAPRDFATATPVEDSAGFINVLSAREREVAALLASGRNNRDVSGILSISIRTVESHRAKIMLKLNLHSLSDLVRYAVRNRLIAA